MLYSWEIRGRQRLRFTNDFTFNTAVLGGTDKRPLDYEGSLVVTTDHTNVLKPDYNKDILKLWVPLEFDTGIYPAGKAYFLLDIGLAWEYKYLTGRAIVDTNGIGKVRDIVKPRMEFTDRDSGLPPYTYGAFRYRRYLYVNQFIKNKPQLYLELEAEPHGAWALLVDVALGVIAMSTRVSKITHAFELEEGDLATLFDTEFEHLP